MPEGPEVRLCAESLRRIVGSRLDSIGHFGGRYAERVPRGFVEWSKASAATDSRPTVASVTSVESKGKLLWISTSDDWHALVTHGMTGRWTFDGSGRHVAFVLHMSGGARDFVLTFDDQRHFGTLRLVHGKSALSKITSRIGPDVLDPSSPLELAQRMLELRARSTVAEAVMDQRVIGGVGNYIKAESLWRARISPHRTVISLAPDEFTELHAAIVSVATRSHSAGGATIETFRDPDGNVGSATADFSCYGRKTDAEGGDVTKELTRDGRTTWWSPSRQR